MSGNKSGGVKASKAIKAKYGSDHYKRIGALGGAAHNKGGFKANPELARIAGAKGGRISRRRPVASPLPKLPVAREEREELNILKTALQQEAAVVSY